MILAIDTALNACSVAIVRGDAVLAHTSEAMDRGQAERIAPMARDAAAQAGVAFRAIERIAVTTGPGSFTGVRVGLAFARGLALALKVPCVGISTLEALALERGASGARAGWVSTPGASYGALYLDGDARVAPQRFASSDLGRAAFASAAQDMAIAVRGPGADRFGETDRFFVDAAISPDAAALAAMSAQRDPLRHPPAPLYLRAPDARPAEAP
ncbi:MAG: tRNA (adenosine(37)-N6)-threonylcarbamoyltransferase complex dimerization subunit type 1 TsaB [Alphaproteobacteria bacterium]|nr:tRNA (adenosine(37)-N6)-threonylcarbamoyltransferase complex dimerization subunit type 1 TsaB [Alphaproteobacteria bacterium]